MTCEEFNNQFDVFYNNIASNQAPGVDAYEKSVFLTRAQEEIVRAYAAPQGNKFAEGFDGSAKRQIDFSDLLTVKTLNPSSTRTFDNRTDIKSVDIPADAFIIVNELVNVSRKGVSTTLNVVPLRFAEYSLKLSEPFKRPLKNQAWRIITGDTTAEIIAGFNDIINNYTIKYIRRPNPIIVEDLSTGITINGKSEAQTCELDENLHQDILQRAVELAKVAYTGDLNTQLSVGLYSETEKGIVPQYNRYR